MRRVSCYQCGRPGDSSLCGPCRGKRPSKSARGYDALYYRNRAVLYAQCLAAIVGGTPPPCCICATPIRYIADFSVEHLVPLRRGGSSALENLAPAHLQCNIGWNRGQ